MRCLHILLELILTGNSFQTERHQSESSCNYLRLRTVLCIPASFLSLTPVQLHRLNVRTDVSISFCHSRFRNRTWKRRISRQRMYVPPTEIMEDFRSRFHPLTTLFVSLTVPFSYPFPRHPVIRINSINSIENDLPVWINVVRFLLSVGQKFTRFRLGKHNWHTRNRRL